MGCCCWWCWERHLLPVGFLNGTEPPTDLVDAFIMAGRSRRHGQTERQRPTPAFATYDKFAIDFNYILFRAIKEIPGQMFSDRLSRLMNHHRRLEYGQVRLKKTRRRPLDRTLITSLHNLTDREIWIGGSVAKWVCLSLGHSLSILPLCANLGSLAGTPSCGHRTDILRMLLEALVIGIGISRRGQLVWDSHYK